jgi:hypothetical protein
VVHHGGKVRGGWCREQFVFCWYKSALVPAENYEIS